MVVGHGHGEDQLETEILEAVVERRPRHLGRIALPPGLGMERPQHLGLAELGHPVQAAMADQPSVAEQAPWRVAALLPGGLQALHPGADRRRQGADRAAAPGLLQEVDGARGPRASRQAWLTTTAAWWHRERRGPILGVWPSAS